MSAVRSQRTMWLADSLVSEAGITLLSMVNSVEQTSRLSISGINNVPTA